jgi:hypothetical protein
MEVAMSLELIPLIVILAFFGAVWRVVVVIAESRRRQMMAKMQSDVHHKLIEKFASGHELTEFLQTPGGVQLIGSLEEPSVKTRPAEGILRSTQIGVILTLLGLGFLSIPGVIHGGVGDKEGPIVIGMLVLSVGIVFLLSSAISYRLSRNWGLLPLNK